VPVILDTGIVYAYYDRSDAWHERAVGLVSAEAGSLLLPAPVIPEVDHLLRHRLGRDAGRVFRRSLADGDYLVADLPQDQYVRVAEIAERFDDLDIGFVDAAVVTLAQVSGVHRIGTTDRRHFEPLSRALGLELLP